MRKIDLIVIHYSATREGHGLPLKQLKRSWSDLGYQFFIHGAVKRQKTKINELLK